MDSRFQQRCAADRQEVSRKPGAHRRIRSDEQGERFVEALGQLRGLQVEPEWIHVSNSAALLTGRKFPENLVRIGASDLMSRGSGSLRRWGNCAACRLSPNGFTFPTALRC